MILLSGHEIPYNRLIPLLYIAHRHDPLALTITNTLPDLFPFIANTKHEEDGGNMFTLSDLFFMFQTCYEMERYLKDHEPQVKIEAEQIEFENTYPWIKAEVGI